MYAEFRSLLDIMYIVYISIRFSLGAVNQSEHNFNALRIFVGNKS